MREKTIFKYDHVISLLLVLNLMLIMFHEPNRGLAVPLPGVMLTPIER
jgi:hypothetical protein